MIENNKKEKEELIMLADHSKFNQVTAVTFAELGQAVVITDRLSDEKYLTMTSVKEVL